VAGASSDGWSRQPAGAIGVAHWCQPRGPFVRLSHCGGGATINRDTPWASERFDWLESQRGERQS